MMHAPMQSSGFSLVEVLVAAAIASLALTGLSSLQITWVHERDLAWQRTQATQWAQQALEQMRMDDQQASPDGETSVSLTSGTTFTRRWSTTPTEPMAVDMPTLLATRMDVSWIDRHGLQHSTRLTKLWVPQDPASIGTIAVTRSALGWLPLRP